MFVDFPPATVTVAENELREAVHDWLVKTGVLQSGGTLNDYGVCDLVETNLETRQVIGAPGAALVGNLTFTLKPQT